MVPQCTTVQTHRLLNPVDQVRPLRNTAAAYLEVLVVAWMDEKVCLSIIFLEIKKKMNSQIRRRASIKEKSINK